MPLSLTHKFVVRKYGLLYSLLLGRFTGGTGGAALLRRAVGPIFAFAVMGEAVVATRFSNCNVFGGSWGFVAVHEPNSFLENPWLSRGLRG